MKRAFASGVTKRPLLSALAIAGVLSAGIMGAAVSAEPATETRGHHGKSWKDGDHGRGFGRGHGHGRGFNRCERFLDEIKDVDKNLTPEQARDIVAGRLAQRGEGNLKTGKVTSKAGVATVEVVTTSGSLVTTREISQKTGLPAAMEKRCEERVAGKDDGKDGKYEGKRHRGHRGGGFMRGLAALGPDGKRDLNLSSDQVKKLAEAYVIMTGNPRLKVGAVKEKDADTVSVDIVTVDNALVVRRDIDRQTGRVTQDD